jgi:hypothetical protein
MESQSKGDTSIKTNAIQILSKGGDAETKGISLSILITERIN